MKDLADYDNKYNPKPTDPKLEHAVNNLQYNWQAPEGRQRLRLVAKHFMKLSPEQAYRLLNPEAYRREVEEIQIYKRRVKVFHFGRIVLGLAPLIVTWGSLSWAVFAYGNYVTLHGKDQGQIPSFLQLWQQGALTGLTFFWTGVLDVALLILFLSFSIYSLVLEHHARSESEKFVQEFQRVSDGLMVAVEREGRKEVTSDEEINKIIDYIKDAIAESYDDLGKIIDDAKDTIVKTGETSKDMFDNQIKPMLTDFGNNAKSFQTDLNALNDKVEELVAASKRMASAADDMAGSASSMKSSATKMADSASDLATNVREQKEISKDMDSHLVELNKTEIAMTQSIENTQKDVAKEVKQSTENLQKAAEKVELIGKAITPQLVKQTADNANLFANKAEQVAVELQNVAQVLKGIRPRLIRWPF